MGRTCRTNSGRQQKGPPLTSNSTVAGEKILFTLLVTVRSVPCIDNYKYYYYEAMKSNLKNQMCCDDPKLCNL